MIYSTLYKRTSTGAVQEWYQELEGGKYRSISGQVGGKKTTSDWMVAKIKNAGRTNATTPALQASLEVESNYARKRKDGYHYNIADAMADARFNPMLAEEFGNYEHKISWPVWSQPKLDGIRCIAKASGLWSRTGERIVAVPHIEDLLDPVFEVFPDIILDGELFRHADDNFNEISSLVRKTKITAVETEASKAYIEYWLYDAVMPGVEEDYGERYSRLVQIHADLDSHFRGVPALIVTPTAVASNREQLDEHYANYAEAKFEGQMVRRSGAYQNKRTPLLLKRKEFVDSEFTVIDIVEGEGNASGGAKVAWLELDTDPTRRFKADIVGTKAERTAVLQNRDALIGKLATVKYFAQRTPAGVPRFGKLKIIHSDGSKW